MKAPFHFHNYDISNKLAQQYLKSTFRLNKAPTSNYNKQIFRRDTTNKIDIEKAHYEAELLLSEKYDLNAIKTPNFISKTKC